MICFCDAFRYYIGRRFFVLVMGSKWQTPSVEMYCYIQFLPQCLVLLWCVYRKKAVNLQMMASGKTPGLTQEATIDREDNADVFDDMKERFLAFKKLKYM